MTFTGRKGTALVIVTVVSVCLNLAFAGFMIGEHLDRRGGGPGRWMFRSVPEDAKPLVDQALAARQGEFDAKRKAVQDARQKVAALLKADTVDRAQLEAAMAEMSQRFRDMAQTGQQVLIDVTMQLTPEQRKEMAEEWAKDRWSQRR
jgi:Spy/CpxP family protein refolding chaperone